MKIRIKKSDGQKLCKLLLCLLIVLVFTGCDLQDSPSGTTSQPEQPAKVYDGTIIALGDSLTAGLGVAEEEAYPLVLEEKLQQNGYNWQVINGGISGETSSGVLSRINWIITQQPDIVILETGAKWVNMLGSLLPGGAIRFQHDLVGLGYCYTLPVSMMPFKK